MGFSQEQKDKLIAHLQQRFMSGDYEGVHIAVSLMAMVKDHLLELSDVKPILLAVHFGNETGAIRALAKARELVDSDMIDSILKEARHP